MNKKFVAIKTVLFIVAIIAVFLYVKKNFDAINSTVLSLSFGWITFIFTLYLVILYNQAKILGVSSTLIQQQKVELSRMMLVNGISSLVGNFIPSGAIASRPLIIQKLIRIPLANATLSVSRVTFTTLFANLILLSLLLSYALPLNFVTHASVIVLVLTTYYLSMYSETIFKIELISETIKRIRALIKPESHRNSIVLLLHCIVQILLLGLVFWSYLIAVGEESPFLKALIISVIGNLSMLVAITPGNLGVKEGIYFILSQKLAINPDVVVNIILIDRLIQITCLVFVNLVCSMLYKKAD